MEIVWGMILGAVQGMTEFLPVSSSGHLVIIKNYLPGLVTSGIILEVILHAGTMLSILFYFRRNLIILYSKYLYFIIIASIPVVIAGVVFRDFWDGVFSNTKFVAVALLITGMINYLTNKATDAKGNIDNKKAFITGMAQAIAIIPGISRSGATIFASVRQGIDAKEAAQFSFLLSVPAIIGANIFELVRSKDVLMPDYTMLIAGFITAFIFGYIAIHTVLKFLEQKKFYYFSIYCFVVGIFFLLF